MDLETLRDYCNSLPHVTEDVKWGNDRPKLLHYHYLSLPYVISRYKAKAARMPEFDKTSGWGVHYTYTRRQITETFNKVWENKEKVI